jgi:pimeloyl-ACP methyl ester carboxylesterase
MKDTPSFETVDRRSIPTMMTMMRSETAILAAAAPSVSSQPQAAGAADPVRNIVLVHGAWADGSSWSGVIRRLQADGYDVIAPQFRLTSLAADVARLRQVLATRTGPTIVAGHSYGGQVVTSLGTDAPHAVGLVYVNGYALDQGETLGEIGANYPPPPTSAHLRVDAQGMAWLPEDDFVKHFAADVDPVQARVMYAVQQPISLSVFQDKMGTPAWKSLPSWSVVGKNDEAIAPDLERFFAQRMRATTIEIASSHVSLVSHPQEVADLIEQAAKRTGK